MNLKMKDSVEVQILKNYQILSSIRKEIDFKFIKKFFDINKNSKLIIICCRSIGSLERVEK